MHSEWRQALASVQATSHMLGSGKKGRQGSLAGLDRFLRSAALSECGSAVYKATIEDEDPPKEKHVQTILRLAAQPEGVVEVCSELTKRLRACHSPQMALAAAKTLVVLLRLITGGHSRGAVLEEAFRELAAVCAGPEGRHPLAEFVAACAGYVRALGNWYGAAALRSPTEPARWSSMRPRELGTALPPLQQVTRRALGVARMGCAASEGGFRALRLWVIEDALALFRSEAVAAAALHAGVLALEPAAAEEALGLLETFTAHARLALELSASLSDEVARAPTPLPGLRELLSARPLWSAATPSLPAAAPAAAACAGAAGAVRPRADSECAEISTAEIARPRSPLPRSPRPRSPRPRLPVRDLHGRDLHCRDLHGRDLHGRDCPSEAPLAAPPSPWPLPTCLRVHTRAQVR